ncbi:glycosyltransferase [Desulfosediminicola sp.]|uniref:glycosyltransferase n=1 Tax=Desulfosediminicola sp. TaxID=2886825 RepID=UPI003AF1FFD4
MKHALFAVSSLGLGHATRTLPVIWDYINRGYGITIISSGNALKILENELGDVGRVAFREMPDYPALERGTGWRLYWYLLKDLHATRKMIKAEHRELKKIEQQYDFIFSDGKYGFYSTRRPSFILTHQIAFMPPEFFSCLQQLTERVNLFALKKFDSILIPDFPEAEHNLSGQLSHSRYLADCNHVFVGILSSYHKLSLTRDIDYLFIISGYLLEHKEAFIRMLVDQANALPGKKVFILGQQDAGAIPDDLGHGDDIVLYPMVDGRDRQKLFNRAKRVISRAGYTTIMDLVEHDKRGLLIPTPNQTEQEYLAEYLAGENVFGTAGQSDELELVPALKRCEGAKRFTPPWRTADSLKKIHNSMKRYLKKQYISVIVPAHNEEAELANTLNCLLKQNYPADRYEVIVVENGSTDTTLEVARNISEQVSGSRNVRVVQSARGVSIAKNVGLSATDVLSEWVVLCDADTHLGPDFLNQLNLYLIRRGGGQTVGTCSIGPRPVKSSYARFWFKTYDYIHRWTKTSYALQIAKTSIARSVGFHPALHLAEDLTFIKECMGYGSFFFLDTDQVSTSTRRFEAFGYLRLSLRWAFEALLPMRVKRLRSYRVVR